MSIVQNILNTYKAMDVQALLLGSRPYKTIYTSWGGNKPLLFKHLRNSSDSYEMNVNGSVTPVDFYIAPPAGETWYISRWMMQLIDGKGFEITEFGSSGSALTNGLDALFESDGVQTSLLELTIKSNSDISAVTYDTRLDSYGNSSDALHASWSLYKTGQMLRLRGSLNEKLVIKIQDNLTSLERLHIHAQGYIG
jgi:hypothetical protein